MVPEMLIEAPELSKAPIHGEASLLEVPIISSEMAGVEVRKSIPRSAILLAVGVALPIESRTRSVFFKPPDSGDEL